MERGPISVKLCKSEPRYATPRTYEQDSRCLVSRESVLCGVADKRPAGSRGRWYDWSGSLQHTAQTHTGKLPPLCRQAGRQAEAGTTDVQIDRQPASQPASERVYKYILYYPYIPYHRCKLLIRRRWWREGGPVNSGMALWARLPASDHHQVCGRPDSSQSFVV